MCSISILVRMQDHHDKKRSLLRRLTAWDHLADDVEPNRYAVAAGDDWPRRSIRLTTASERHCRSPWWT